MENLQAVDLYSTFDRPYPFTKGDNKLLLYPVLMKDFFMFQHCAEVILIDKNNIPDIEIMKMSYLEFLIRQHTPENQYINRLVTLLSMVMRDENLEFKYSNDKPIFMINGVELGKYDFDTIRKILCIQNELEMPNEKMSSGIKAAIQEANAIRAKMSGTKMASIEDQMIAVSISSGMSLQDIYDMPIRKFVKMLARIDHKLHYEIYLAASMSGLVTFKDKSFIKHWLIELKSDENHGLIPYEEFENKFKNSGIK